MTHDAIERWPGSAPGRSRATAAGSLVWTVAAGGGAGVGLAQQTRDALAAIDRHLADAGTSRDRVVSATVYVADIEAKAEMDAVWADWVGPTAWPQRACVQVTLPANVQVEIVAIAVR